MNWLDRAIAVVSPKTAAQRARYRMAVQHYDGAGATYRQKGWKAPAGNANTTNRGALSLLRRRSRDMVRNNAIARRAVDTIVNNVVGDGIIPSVEADDKGLKTEIDRLLSDHLDTKAIDAHGLLNFYGMQRLALRTIIESGEVLWQRRSRRPFDGLPLNFQIETLEPEFIDDRHIGRLASGNTEYDGIEFDLIGRRVAYRLYERHPEEYFNGYPESRRVLARTLIHGFNVERAGQHRGVPWLAPVMSLVADSYDFMDAQLLRQKIANMFVGFTRDTLGEGIDINAGGTDQDMVDDLVPGMFEHLPPGRDVTFNDPPKADGADASMSQYLHMVAAGLGITYEALSMQLGEVNFSSSRMGRLEMNRTMSAHQWAMFIPQICQPFEVWLREYLADRVGPGRDYRIKWTPPRFEMVDPAREVPPLVQSIEAGLTSRQRVIRSNGFDAEEIDRERVEDREREDEMGLSAPEETGNEGNTP